MTVKAGGMRKRGAEAVADEQQEESTDCDPGEEIGPDGYCIPIEDDGRQCPQGQIKNESGNCVEDSRLECRKECPEYQELNVEECKCYNKRDFWDWEEGQEVYEDWWSSTFGP